MQTPDDAIKNMRSEELRAAVARAYEASRARAEREQAESRLIFQIDIPEQHLTIQSKQLSEYTIRTLKSIGVRGTWRQTRSEQ